MKWVKFYQYHRKSCQWCYNSPVVVFLHIHRLIYLFYHVNQLKVKKNRKPLAKVKRNWTHCLRSNCNTDFLGKKIIPRLRMIAEIIWRSQRIRNEAPQWLRSNRIGWSIGFVIDNLNTTSRSWCYGPLQVYGIPRFENVNKWYYL